MLQPIIKWSGSKRSQAKQICKNIIKEYQTYYQPFCGGCSMLFYILNYYNFNFKKYICSDLNKGLIDTFNLIKNNPKQLQLSYFKLWNQLNKDNDCERKKVYFNQIRKQFNKTGNPNLFLFIMRTATNGMPRYNQNGQFNNSFHVTRNGMYPQQLSKILYEWSNLLNQYNVEFINQSYQQINPLQKDFVYLDPPYASTKGMYYGTIDFQKLWQFLKNLKCDYIMSFDGIAGQQNMIYNVPENIYNKHLLIDSGNSSFRRVIGNNKNCNVKESLYLNIKN